MSIFLANSSSFTTHFSDINFPFLSYWFPSENPRAKVSEAIPPNFSIPLILLTRNTLPRAQLTPLSAHVLSPAPTVSVMGVAGLAVELPCHVPHDELHVNPVLLLWYRDGNSKPVYR